MGGSATPLDAVAPGAPVTLAIPDGVLGVRVERPDGSVDELVAPTADAATVTFARTDLLGVYTVTGIPDPAASAAPASPAASPAGSPGTPAGVPTAASGPTRFAVDLLDVDESRIAPGDPGALTALGAAAGQSGAGTGGGDRPNARDELWIPIVLVALLVLSIEWLVYERDTLARLRRAIAARLGRPAGAPGRGA
jgi:hypothetical protein